MSAPDREPTAPVGFWTPRQRRIAALAAAVLVAALAVRLWQNPVELARAPEPGPRAAELADRLDPNVADETLLAAVPHMSDRRARAIVAYRQEFGRRHPRRRAFNSVDDLLAVAGITPEALEQLRPFLFVPPVPPATGPASAPARL